MRIFDFQTDKGPVRWQAEFRPAEVMRVMDPFTPVARPHETAQTDTQPRPRIRSGA